ncbi:MAG: DUF4041 domain-containing protein [Acidimicrobiia bacterium]|nr:DUF4041 domain-containing protein [Acidimicrobiia bacterium]
MTTNGPRFNPPPDWPQPPEGWVPPAGWTPDPAWPDPPDGWELWLPSITDAAAPESGDAVTGTSPPPRPEPSQIDEPDSGLSRRLAVLESENAALRAQLAANAGSLEDLVVLDDERVLQSVGIYRYHHPLEDAVAYKERLTELGTRISHLVKSDQAIEKSNMFTFDNSLAKGRKMTNDLATLMLRAYNAESDNSIRSLRVGNVVTAKRRLEASRSAIARLGRMMEMKISDAFHELRLEEIELTADWLMKKQEEKEAAREERAQLREERRVEKELAEERSRLDKERAHIEKALAALHESGEDDAELEARLSDLDEAIAQNDYRIANIRAGYVYVISNRGAFGENVVKIGLTRRLEPQDRISELSGASVPFRFDVHALFFSEDAVSLETELHHHFADAALNMANSRKEFFFATPAEVRQVLADKVGNLLEFTEHAEATEYMQSLMYWPDSVLAPGTPSAT